MTEPTDPSDAANAGPDENSPKRDGSPGAAGQRASPADPLAAVKREAADNYDRYLRATADLENFRRRTVREKEELRLFATSRVLEDLLPVLDNLALGLGAAKQPGADSKTLTGGIEMVLQQFKSLLANHGLKEINPIGQPFDPHQHEAISHLSTADVKPEHVVTVVRPGYLLNGRLLRPAAVIVSGGPAKLEAAN